MNSISSANSNKNNNKKKKKGSDIELHKLYSVERGVSGDSYNPFQGSLSLDDILTSTSTTSPSTNNNNNNRMVMSSWYDIALICAHCNQAEVESTPTDINNHNEKDGEYRAIGEPTEAALRVLVEKIGIGKHKYTSNHNNNDMHHRVCSNYWSQMYSRLSIFEFTRERKKMSVLCRLSSSMMNNTRTNNNKLNRNKNKNNRDALTNTLLVKGAAEMVVDKCKYIKLEDGGIHEITAQMRRSIAQLLKDMSSRPLRCVALAYTQDAHTLGQLSHCTDADQVRDVLKSSTTTTLTTPSHTAAAATTTIKSEEERVTGSYDMYEKDLILVSIILFLLYCIVLYCIDVCVIKYCLWR